jgi:hypothetical protein
VYHEIQFGVYYVTAINFILMFAAFNLSGDLVDAGLGQFPRLVGVTI